MNKRAAILGLCAAATFAAVGCAPPPKVLKSHAFFGPDKTVQTYIQLSGETVGSGKDQVRLFNYFVRVCNQQAENTTTECKDQEVLSNVHPGSI